MWKMILYIFLMSILTTGLSSLAPDAEIEAMFLSSKGNDFYGKLSNISSTFAPTALLPLEEFEAFSDKSLLRKINRKCIEDSRHYVKSLWNESEWALSMYHASGRVSIDESTNFLIAGLGINVHQDPGLFDQCIATISPSGRIRGQYCSVFLSAQTLLKHNNSSFLNEPKVTIAERPINNGRPVNTANSIIGFCLPSSCSAKDIRTAVAHKIGRTTFRTKNKNGTVTVQSIVTSNHDRLCNSQIKIQDQHALDATCIAFIVITCFVGLLILIATLRECWMRTAVGPLKKNLDDQNHLSIRVLHCFSASRNFKYLLSTDSAADDIQCLHGIRVLSFFLIVIYHTAIEIFRHPIYDKALLIQVQASWHVQPGTNLTVVVDTFFLMGGLLVFKSLSKYLDRDSFSLFRRFYFHRYFRLTPLYAGILFFLTAFGSRIGSGPNWNFAMYRSEDCRLYWWPHLTYINNNAPFCLTFCMADTWYLATEMQMFIFSPIVIYPLWRWKKRAGLILIVLLLAASFSYSTAIYLAWDLPPTIMLTRPLMMLRSSKYLHLYYLNPFARCPPYLIGILLGWILHKTKNSTFHFNKSTCAVGWILSIVMLTAVLYGPYPYLDEESAPVVDPFFSVMYGVFHRAIWSIALALIIFLCAKGYGGKVNDLLSSKIFVPLAKICFSGYLVHYNVIVQYVSQFRIPFYFTPSQFFVAYFGILVLTLIISTFLTIIIEIPFQNLEKNILRNTLLLSWKNRTNSTPLITERKSIKEE